MCERLLAAGATAEEVARGGRATCPTTPDARRCLELRAQLGTAREPEAPGVRAAERRAGAADQLDRWLRMARLVRTSLEVNGGICRSLLQVRHELVADPEEVAR